MSELSVSIQVLSHARDLNIPTYATTSSAGMDLCAAVGADIILKPGERCLIPTGLSIALPEGYEAQIRPRSGLAFKHGLTVLNSPGTIDADYRGEIQIILWNAGHENFTITRGTRIAQMVVAAYTRVLWKVVDELTSTERGQGGFGSTGTKVRSAN